MRDVVARLTQGQPPRQVWQDGIIESKVIRAASETFAAAIGEVEAALPTIEVSVINNLEQAWARQKFLLQQRSYESLEAEADKAKQKTDHGLPVFHTLLYPRAHWHRLTRAGLRFNQA